MHTEDVNMWTDRQTVGHLDRNFCYMQSQQRLRPCVHGDKSEVSISLQISLFC